MNIRICILFFMIFGISAKAQNEEIVSNSNNQFAVQFYKNLSQSYGEKNVFFSPFSITSAMAIPYYGARSQTKAEFREIFYFPDDPALFGLGYKYIISDINGKPEADTVLDVANSLWLQEGISLTKSFRGALTSFHAYSENVNFRNPENHRDISTDANSWVQKHTRGMIDNIVSPSMFNHLTRFLIINAIYFDGKWESAYSEERTREQEFYLTSGDTVKTPFIRDKRKLNYFSNDLLKAIEMPYKAEGVSMYAFLPKENGSLADFSENFSIDTLQHFIKAMTRRKVAVRFPKFNMSSKIDVKKRLKAMGMSRAFSEKADFSGIIGKKNIFIDKVIHKSRVEVDETGTEAAAATGVTLQAKSASVKPEPVVFEADHPFCFLIMDRSRDIIYFMGNVYEFGR